MTDSPLPPSPCTLYLVRHGKAVTPDGELHDFERPLNSRGRRDAAMMAREIVRGFTGEAPVVLSSPAVRAISTARAFADALGLGPRAMRVDARLYEATAGDWLTVLQEQPRDDRCIFAFGHNPGISAFADWLSAEGPAAELPTSGVIGMHLARDWPDLEPGCGHPFLRLRPQKA